MGACATTAPRTIPREIVYEASAGTWTLITDPVTGRDHAPSDAWPDTIPIVTMLDGERIDRMRLARGTPGFARTARGYPSKPDVDWAEVMLPYRVRQDGSRWRVDGIRFVVAGEELIALREHGIPATVPLWNGTRPVPAKFGIGNVPGHCGTGLSRREARRRFGPFLLASASALHEQP